MTDINIDGVVTWLGNWFQDKLESGTNIKTINNQSILGSGNISVSGGGGITIDDVYPVGSIYMSVNSTSPAALFGGTWEQLTDTFLYASTTADTGTTATAGASTVALTEAQMPRHTHTQNSHNHTQNAHHHGNNTSGWKWISVMGDDWTYTGKRAMSYGSGNYYYPYSSKNTSGIAESTQTGDTTPTNNSQTATNKYTGGSGTSESASNGSAHNNMPPYMKVFMWKRTG